MPSSLSILKCVNIATIQKYYLFKSKEDILKQIFGLTSSSYVYVQVTCFFLAAISFRMKTQKIGE